MAAKCKARPCARAQQQCYASENVNPNVLVYYNIGLTVNEWLMGVLVFHLKGLMGLNSSNAVDSTIESKAEALNNSGIYQP